MRMIIATVRPQRFEAVREALIEVGVDDFSVTEVKAHGPAFGHAETYRGTRYTVDFETLIRIEIVVSDEKLEAAAEAISKAARTEKRGDGRIFIMSGAERAVRIHTGELLDGGLS